jgi:hypothetical protein
MDSWGLLCRVVAEVGYNGCVVVMWLGKVVVRQRWWVSIVMVPLA